MVGSSAVSLVGSRPSRGSSADTREPIRVLLVEDNPGDASLCRAHLEGGSEPVALTVVDTLADALDLLPGTFELVLFDLFLPDARGLPGLLRVLQACDRPVVVLSGLEDDACARACVEAGAQDYVDKNAMEPRVLRRALDFARARLRGRRVDAPRPISDRAELVARRHEAEVARSRALLRHGLELRDRCASLQQDIADLLRDSRERVRGLSRLARQLDTTHAAFEGPLRGTLSTLPSPLALVPPRRRVLLVDDDALLLRAVSRLLRRHHDVVTAHGGEKALACLRAGERFDVMLCDLMMPGLDGVQTLAAVRAEFPAMAERFVVLTGGAATPRTRDFLAHADVPVVSKPVALETLLAAVDERTRSK